MAETTSFISFIKKALYGSDNQNLYWIQRSKAEHRYLQFVGICKWHQLLLAVEEFIRLNTKYNANMLIMYIILKTE